MTVTVHTSLEDLSSLDIDILAYKNQKNLFYSIEWFRCLSELASPQHTSVRIYVVAADGDSSQRCYLFCYRERGSRVLSLSNFYSMEFAPVFSASETHRGAL